MKTRFRVTRKRMEADQIWSFLLEPIDGAPQIPYTAGAHVSIHLPSGIVRQYSLCDPVAPVNAYEICVLRAANSRGGSIELCERVIEGDVLLLEAPVNRFPLLDHGGPAVLMAGGIGLTPLLAMARELHSQGRDFKLNYFARSEGTAAFASALRGGVLSENVTFHYGSDLTRQQAAIQDCVRVRPDDAHLYVCGPTAFIDFVLTSSRSLGWPTEALHWEHFNPVPLASPSEDRSFDLIVGSTGRRINVPVGQTALEAMLAAGIAIPASCEQGICGTCLTGVLQGEVLHRDSYLTPEERARNDQFLPCCSRAKGDLLVVDL